MQKSKKYLIVLAVVFIILILSLGFYLCYSKENNIYSNIQNVKYLQQNITDLIKDKNLNLGVAVYSESKGNIVNINENAKFPMQSVYKLPIAIAFLDRVDKAKYSISDSIEILEKDLLPNTWSPFRDKYPKGTQISIFDFISYVVAMSDNNLCDVMIDKAGGVVAVNNFIKSKGIEGIAIKNYERELKQSWDLQFENYSTPEAVINLLLLLEREKFLKSETTNLLMQVLLSTQTGSARKLLPNNAKIAYKTGFSGKNKDGLTAANNCVGIIETASNEKLYFAIFITNSKESDEYNYMLISEILKLVYNYKSESPKY